MPEHEIEVGLPAKAMLNLDTTVTIKSDGQKLGELRISKGSVDWKSANKKTPKKISWERFAAMLDNA